MADAAHVLDQVSHSSSRTDSSEGLASGLSTDLGYGQYSKYSKIIDPFLTLDEEISLVHLLCLGEGSSEHPRIGPVVQCVDKMQSAVPTNQKGLGNFP